MIKRLSRGIGLALLALVILLSGLWCSIAVWFQSGAGTLERDLLAGSIVALTVVLVGAVATSRRWLAGVVYAGLLAAFLGWWSTIAPSRDRIWTPDVDRTVTANIDGDRLTVTNVRNFTWRANGDFDPAWEQRSYSLSQVANVDLIMSYWAGEAIAHTMLSFGFDDGSRLVFSIETRKERGESYSALAGFFKQYELVFVAADERDIVRVRSNVRGEDVRIYRLRMTPANALLLLRQYVDEANDLARAPRFYNTLTANCTSMVFKLVRFIHPDLPLDFRVLLSGYLPDYVYDLGAIDTRLPFPQLREQSKIHERAIQADAALDFSAKIREGAPASQ